MRLGFLTLLLASPAFAGDEKVNDGSFRRFDLPDGDEKLSDSPEEKIDQSGGASPQVAPEPEDPFSFLSNEDWIYQLRLNPCVAARIIYEARMLTCRQQPGSPRDQENPYYLCVVKQRQTGVPRRIDQVCGWYAYCKFRGGEPWFRSIRTDPSGQSLSCIQEFYSPLTAYNTCVMAICRGPGDRKLFSAYGTETMVAASPPFRHYYSSCNYGSYSSGDWQRNPQNLTWEEYYNEDYRGPAGISVITEDQIKQRMYELLLRLWRDALFCKSLNRSGLPLMDAKGWITDVNAVKDELNHLGLLLKELGDYFRHK